MKRPLCITLLFVVPAASFVAGAAARPAAFRGTISPLTPALRAQMTGVSWHSGCPVPLRNLRLLTLGYRGFDGRSHTGRLVVNRSVAARTVAVFRRLYRAGFPIRRMRLSSSWSNHAYGLAIDINPIENPYVTASGSVAHRASRPYLNRSRVRPGMAYPGGELVDAFRSAGWGWGGYWSGDRDYQHFSANGR